MFILKGKVLSQRKVALKDNTEITRVQVLANGSGYHQLYEVTDFDNRQWPIEKEINIPVKIKVWATERSKGMNITALSTEK